MTVDMMSPTADPEVPMDYTTEYDTSDKSSMDDSDEGCSIPGSFSPDNNQDGTSGDQRYEETFNILSNPDGMKVIFEDKLVYNKSISSCCNDKTEKHLNYLFVCMLLFNLLIFLFS